MVRVGSCPGVVAFLCEVTVPWQLGGEGVSSQPYLGPRGAGTGPGDKMFDWVSPPAGMRPLSLIRPSLGLGGKTGSG